MKVVLVNASPNTDGVCNYAMQLMTEELQAAGVETDYYQIGKQAIRGCMDCGGCEKIGKCVYNDLVNVVHEAMKSADGFVIASPVHYASASGAATSFMDRLFYSGSKDLRYKPG
ncbi:MAG: NAD(P)H-dependent oxidoreductase, partial [Erysipelotrichaceae bacterium]|nr:NAD(P)H-dependent oxidoreductase [Erysipelotrichaceae bacterium]